MNIPFTDESGNVICCSEKIKVLNDAIEGLVHEYRSGLEDSVLMGADLGCFASNVRMAIDLVDAEMGGVVPTGYFGSEKAD